VRARVCRTRRRHGEAVSLLERDDLDARLHDLQSGAAARPCGLTRASARGT
jgi:hypothetical protein